MAGAVCLDYPVFAAKPKDTGAPLLKVGILSDLHIHLKYDKAGCFRHALEYFRDNNVDAVMITGDMTDFGLECELQIVADIWYDVFPEDKAPDGHHVEKLFVLGNHDVGFLDTEKFEGQTLGSMSTTHIGNHPAEVWEKVFHEKWTPIYMKDVKGFVFVGAHFENEQSTTGLGQFFDSVKQMLPKEQPFFFFQHMHPAGTCSSPWATHDNGESTAILAGFHNAVVFSGHSHTSLTDERTLWQGSFTSVGTGSMKYIIPFGGRENSGWSEEREPGDLHMLNLDCSSGKQGMLMTVNRDSITLERREFMYDQPLGDDWVIPLPLSDRPLTFEARRKAAVAPQFPDGVAVKVSSPYMGYVRSSTKTMQVKVTFPPVVSATSPAGVRAFDYEVQAVVADVDTYKSVVTKRVYSKAFFLGEDREGVSNVECVFGVDELPKGRRFRFAVRPCECFGRAGEPVYSDDVVL